MKKKLDEETKIKLMYSGELLVIAIVFGVLGVLKITGIFGYNEKRRLIFNWITLFGGLWGIIDFVWMVASKRRREKNSPLDKILVLPLVIFIETYNLISLIAKPTNQQFYLTMLGIAFIYVAVIYIFEAIYHYYHPIPALFEDDEKQDNSDTVK